MPNEKETNDCPILSFIVIAAAIAVLLMLFSCNEARQIEKAEQRVMLNPAALDHVGKAWATAYPCANDTSFITTLGETLILQDTVYKHSQSTDTVQNFYYDTIQITKTLRRVDTMVVAITDQRAIKIAYDSIQSCLRITARLQGNNDELKQTIIQDNSRVTKLLIWLILTWVGIVVGIVVSIKMKVL